MLIDEPVAVELSPGGTPVRFSWRGTTYGVISAPEPWLAREPWWKTASRANRTAPVRLERQLWRVDAVPLREADAFEISFDLAPGREGWRLAQAFSASLDEQLFA